jgi:polar amino acid transport system substrate-binding protein
MTPSKARAEVFDFPVEYYASPAVIVVNAKDERIHGAKDLSGRKVGLTSASSYESYLNKNLVIEGAEDTQIEYPFETCRSPRTTPTTSPSRTWAWAPACAWTPSSPTW